MRATNHGRYLPSLAQLPVQYSKSLKYVSSDSRSYTFSFCRIASRLISIMAGLTTFISGLSSIILRFGAFVFLRWVFANFSLNDI